jgi:sulfate adenylyltransferase subunit 1
MDMLRLITCGNVDDGKSTLIGRLLFDSKSLFEDQLEAVQRASVRQGNANIDLSLLTDGLREEREKRITIDVAYRYFATPQRKFILADCPGHFEYTRNMVTGASTAHVALLLVDVRKGLTTQTRRHAFIATLLRIKHIVVCVNKMDLVGFSQAEFDNVCGQFMEYAERFDGVSVQFIPMSALLGDNVVERSAKMPWYAGGALLHALETIYVRNDANHIDSRFPVQSVVSVPSSESHGFTGYAGQVASGVFRQDDEIVHMPTGLTARIRSLKGPAGPVEHAFHPMSVVIELDREMHVGRGDILARPNNQSLTTSDPEMMLCWLSESPLDPSRIYLLKHTTRETECKVSDLRYKLDVTTLHRSHDKSALSVNEFARISVHTAAPIFYDSYRKNRQTGSVLLIDGSTNATLAAGMLL